MSANRQTLMGRNPPRSAVKKKGICGVCGEDVIAATLVRQRHTFVSYLHHGCLDSLRVYMGPKVRGPGYGGGYPMLHPILNPLGLSPPGGSLAGGNTYHAPTVTHPIETAESIATQGFDGSGTQVTEGYTAKTTAGS